MVWVFVDGCVVYDDSRRELSRIRVCFIGHAWHANVVRQLCDLEYEKLCCMALTTAHALSTLDLSVSKQTRGVCVGWYYQEIG